MLLAVEISPTAMERARARLSSDKHVDLLRHDINDGVPGDDYDLIICSEVLYYLRDGAAVAAFAKKLRDSLIMGGHLLMTHANMVSDDRDSTGFDFNEIGAKFIGKTFAHCEGLEFTRELRTELYRVQLFRRTDNDQPGHAAPAEVVVRHAAEFNHSKIKWGGCAVTAAEAENLWCFRQVPVLMFHRIAKDGPADLAPYRLSPVRFERLLAWLKRYGWHSLDLASYCQKRYAEGRDFFPGKAVIFTFDDAYVDFFETAWPLLRHYGFSATVFIPVDFVGGRAEWDAKYGEPAPIMDWSQIKELHRQGVAFGSHGCTHRRVHEMAKDELRLDAHRSKVTIEEQLGTPILGYCYPYAVTCPALYGSDCRLLGCEAGLDDLAVRIFACHRDPGALASGASSVADSVVPSASSSTMRVPASV